MSRKSPVKKYFIEISRNNSYNKFILALENNKIDCNVKNVEKKSNTLCTKNKYINFNIILWFKLG